jgi:hypothetical protein
MRDDLKTQIQKVASKASAKTTGQIFEGTTGTRIDSFSRRVTLDSGLVVAASCPSSIGTQERVVIAKGSKTSKQYTVLQSLGKVKTTSTSTPITVIV